MGFRNTWILSVDSIVPGMRTSRGCSRRGSRLLGNTRIVSSVSSALFARHRVLVRLKIGGA